MGADEGLIEKLRKPGNFQITFKTCVMTTAMNRKLLIICERKWRSAPLTKLKQSNNRRMRQDIFCGTEVGKGRKIKVISLPFPTSVYFYWTFNSLTKKAILSAASSIILAVGLPAPCPARVSMRIKTGWSPVCAACIVAAYLKLCAGTTRSS